MTIDTELNPVTQTEMRISLAGTMQVLSVSNHIETLLGCSPDSFLSGCVTLQSRIHPDDQDISRTLFSTAVDKPADAFNLRLRQANGRIVCVKGSYRKYPDATIGNLVLELQLQDARSLQRTLEDDSMLVNFKAIMDNTDDFIFFKDRNHVFTGASQTLVKITDPSEHWSDLLGKTDYDVFPEEYADIYYRLEKQVFAGIQVAHEVQEYMANDGRKGWVDNRKYPIRDANGTIIGLFGIARDISEQKRTEQALRNSEHLLSAVINEMPDVLVLKDHLANFVLCNKTVANLYNTTPEAMVGKHDGDFGVPKEMADGFRDNVLGIMARGQTEIVFEDSRDVVSGEVRHFKSIKKPFKDAQGNNQILILAHDITDVILAQEKVAESERRLQEVLDVTREGIWDWNIPSGKVSHNARWYLILGYQEGEIDETVDTFATLIHPDDKQMVWQRIDDLMTGRSESYYSEHRLRGKGGHYLWVQDRGRVVRRDEAGGAIRAVGSYSDITEKKLAELAFQLEREKLQLIVDHAPIGIWLQDGSGKLSFVNKAFCQAMGIPEEQFLAVPHYIELIPEAFRPQCLASDAKALESDGVSISQQQLPFADGQVHDLRVIKAVKRDAQGAVLAMVGLSMDITEELKQQRALRESEQRFRNVFEQVPSISVQGYDRTRRVIFWNQASEEMYGFPREAVLGRSLEELIIPEPMRDSVVRMTLDWINGGAPIPASELTLQKADGSPVEVFSSHVMLRGANDEPEMYCIDIDITERKRAEAELAKYRHHLEELVEDRTVALSIAKDAAEAASRAKSVFLANMSHELRTPMNGVMGMIDMARRRMTDPMGLDQLGKAKTAATNLLGVLNDILDLSKIEAERMVLEDVPLQLADTIANLADVLNHKATEKGIKLVVDLPGDLASAPLKGDPLRLGQILFNLVGNAIKFTEQGAVILGAHSVGETPEAVQVRFEVRDTGIGIEPEVQTRLFQSFEQADNSMTRKYGGTGLGLAICKRLVQLMGGEIGAESRVGQGSIFWFVVPLKKHETSAVPPAPTFTGLTAEQRLHAEYAGTRILLAEDEPISQIVSCGLLEDVGLMVDLAKDGQQALELAKQNPYALILMDMQMPDMNGIEATQAIRTLSGYAKTPILAMTANAFDEDRQACIDAGMNDHIAKPVDPQKLYETLLAWLEKRGH